MGDHGGILVACNDLSSGPTNIIYYSTDEGETWNHHQFNKEKVNIYALITEPGENTTVFTMFGSNPIKHEWVLFKVNFTDAFGEFYIKFLENQQ